MQIMHTQLTALSALAAHLNSILAVSFALSVTQITAIGLRVVKAGRNLGRAICASLT